MRGIFALLRRLLEVPLFSHFWDPGTLAVKRIGTALLFWRSLEQRFWFWPENNGIYRVCWKPPCNSKKQWYGIYGALCQQPSRTGFCQSSFELIAHFAFSKNGPKQVKNFRATSNYRKRTQPNLLPPLPAGFLVS